MVWKGKIESLTLQGNGVGIKEGEFKRPIFIPMTCPGDLVEASIKETRGKYIQGSLLKVIEASPQRRKPRCQHFGICGGCQLQHVSYEEQLRQKANQIRYELERYGVVYDKEITVLPSRKLHKYRWRGKVWVSFSGNKASAGFRKQRSHDIIEVKECFIVMPHIMEFISLINASSCKELADVAVPIITVVGEKEKLGLLVELDEVPSGSQWQVREFFEDLYAQNRKLLGNLFFRIGRKVKTAGQVQEHITYSCLGLRFSFLPETFIQSNVRTNELLVKTALEMLAPQEEERILDLYAGIGNLSLPIAKRCKEVVAVEGNGASVTAAEMNLIQNAIGNVKFHRSSVEKFPKDKYDAVVVDPPRTGCSEEVLDRISKNSADRILYVSCDPRSFARDTSKLGYNVEKVVGVDMFPDISHIELVALLKK